MKKNGFTLVEVIIAISVLGIIGYTLVSVLSRSFSAGNKSQAVSSLKQNGQNIVNTLESNIRDAQAIVCLNPVNSDIITLQKKDGVFIRYYVKSGTSGNPNIILEDHPVLEDLSLSVDTRNFCNLSLVPEKQTVALSDADPNNGVSVQSLKFIINDNPGIKDSINISFNLKSWRDKATIESFQTTVQLR